MKRMIATLLLWAGAVALAAVCYHSVEEIHYLKSFFPRSFTVAEACYAAVVELIKVAIIALPILVVMGLGLYLRAEGSRGRQP
jgi:hypothetical protein